MSTLPRTGFIITKGEYVLRSRIRRIGLLSFMGVIAATLIAPVAVFAAAPNVRQGSANVDGNVGEWNLNLDFFGSLHAGSNDAFPARADAYARYDCSSNVLYVYVKARPGETIKTDEPNDQYIRIDNTGKLVSDLSGDNGQAPDFRFVRQIGTAAAGWEASGKLAPGNYDIRIFTKVTADDTDGYDAILRDTQIGMDCPKHEKCSFIFHARHMDYRDHKKHH